ncbi:3e5d6244-29df-4a14-8489-43e67c1175c3 [Thermothielavioides terrestris]|uniref:3e5d6244-29df-4a14-8489-43e67c1175c3 n=1 Tax=Thermothielavioides terrestris TaxID=2587410 RepID=A0A446BAV0_9PEZI|nr:3e5d6244-29df-4a14-8489-43e67c1175c3 [Thermothielavioides terrestris]
MKLTPIKIKGKAGPRKVWRPPNRQRVSHKRAREEDDDAPDERAGAPPRRRFKSKKPAAAVEELPTEILERIIFMSRNLNFLRSSLRLGYRFSSRSFLTELLEAAFAPTWDVWYGRRRHEVMPHQKDLLDPKRIPGDPDFQGAVLACPWVNVGLVLEAQQKWCRRNGGPGMLLANSTPPSATVNQGLTDAAARFEEDWKDVVLVHSWGASLRPEMWELTGRGYDNIAAASDRQLALVIFLLLAQMDAFSHWPLFLIEQKLDAARQLQQTAPPADRLLWQFAGTVLENYGDGARLPKPNG